MDQLFKIPDDASNGVRDMLMLIDKNREHMPDAMRDDMTFGAMFVVYDQGKSREKKIRRLERIAITLAGMTLVGFVIDLGLANGDNGWIADLIAAVLK
jgi:hypothetical protein